MNHSIIDLKVAALGIGFSILTFANCQFVMQVIAFVITVGYTTHRWIRLIKHKNDRE